MSWGDPGRSCQCPQYTGRIAMSGSLIDKDPLSSSSSRPHTGPVAYFGNQKIPSLTRSRFARDRVLLWRFAPLIQFDV